MTALRSTAAKSFAAAPSRRAAEPRRAAAARRAAACLTEPLEDRRLFAAAGAPDPSFSGDGYASAAPAGGFAVVALDTRGGRTVVLGSSTGTAAGGVVPGGGNLYAYNSAGNRDTTFSGDGIRPIPRVTAPRDVFIQPDGKILVLGTVDGRPGLARVRADGGADTSFGNAGFVTLNLFTEATAVRVAPDGKVVVAGRIDGRAGYGQLAAARLNGNGSLDTTFSGDGYAGAGNGFGATGVAVQADGKVVVVGTLEAIDGGTDVGAYRYTAAGEIDGSFSEGGQFRFNDGTDDNGRSIDLTPHGRILLGVTVRQNGAGVLRLDQNGAVDLDLTAEGVAVVTPVATGAPVVRSSFDGSQFYLFAYPTSGGLPASTHIVRFDADGTRDHLFGVEGDLVTNGEVVGDLTADGKLMTAGNPAGGAGTSYGPYDPTVLQVRRRLTTGAAADRFRLVGHTVVIEGYANQDTVNASTAANGTLTVTFNGTSKTFAAGVVTLLDLEGNGGDDKFITSNALVSVLAYGGDGYDTITTGNLDDVVDGGIGNDALTTNGGKDTLYGGEGNDIVDGGAGDDYVIGDGGYGAVTGDRGADLLFGRGGNDVLSGSSLRGAGPAVFADNIDGGTEDDTAFFVDIKDTVSHVETFH